VRKGFGKCVIDGVRKAIVAQAGSGMSFDPRTPVLGLGWAMVGSQKPGGVVFDEPVARSRLAIDVLVMRSYRSDWVH